MKSLNEEIEVSQRDILKKQNAKWSQLIKEKDVLNFLPTILNILAAELGAS